MIPPRLDGRTSFESDCDLVAHDSDLRIIRMDQPSFGETAISSTFNCRHASPPPPLSLYTFPSAALLPTMCICHAPLHGNAAVDILRYCDLLLRTRRPGGARAVGMFLTKAVREVDDL